MRHRYRQGGHGGHDPGASDKDPARRAQETRTFGTTRREVLALADWLRCWQVPAVVMEATGDYWKGPFYRLEAEGFECVLADAKQVRHPPEAGSGGLAVAGGVLRARHHHRVFRGHPGVPDYPGAHPVPARPDRRTHAQLEEALEGAEFFTPEHAALLAVMLERIDGSAPGPPCCPR